MSFTVLLIKLFCHSLHSELPTYLSMNSPKVLLKLPVFIALDLGIHTALHSHLNS